MIYVGLDVHKKVIAYCVKTHGGKLLEAGEIRATRPALDALTARLRRPWCAAMEATLFTGWIYDHLQPQAQQLKVAHPAMLKAISASKKKNDRIDAEKIVDLLRCDLLPECHMAPASIREPRRVLRYRNLIVRESTRLKNKISGFLMECGVEYNKDKLHGKRYFAQLLGGLDQQTPESVRQLLRISRSNLDLFDGLQRELLDKLASEEGLRERLTRLRRIDGVGQILALSWALEIGDPRRFGSLAQAISYCGLCSAQDSSAGKDKRGPISKMRNKHIQAMLIEAAKLAPRYNQALAQVHQRELARGNKNRATLAVARKLVAYLLAADKQEEAFENRSQPAVANEAAADGGDPAGMTQTEAMKGKKLMNKGSRLRAPQAP
jgi:transposase